MDSQQLETTVMEAINSFDSNRQALFAAAEAAGGDDAVNKLLTGYNALREQYNALIAAELAVNEAAYTSLSDRAGQEAEALKSSIDTLNDINQTITLTASVVSVLAA